MRQCVPRYVRRCIFFLDWNLFHVISAIKVIGSLRKFGDRFEFFCCGAVMYFIKTMFLHAKQNLEQMKYCIFT
jgi:hypothetical protein